MIDKGVKSYSLEIPSIKLVNVKIDDRFPPKLLHTSGKRLLCNCVIVLLIASKINHVIVDVLEEL